MKERATDENSQIRERAAGELVKLLTNHRETSAILGELTSQLEGFSSPSEIFVFIKDLGLSQRNETAIGKVVALSVSLVGAGRKGISEASQEIGAALLNSQILVPEYLVQSNS